MTMHMDQWLIDHLIQGGHMAESGAMRRARLRTCPRGCGQLVLIGLDGLICAVEARVDPQPLSPLGEALALLEGRMTVGLHREGGRYVIDARVDFDIAGKPAGTEPREDVLRQHRCGTALEPAMTAPSNFAVAKPAAITTEPPF